MLLRFWPRSIRWQILLSLFVVEAVSLAVFAGVVSFLGVRQTQRRAQLRLEHQTRILAMEGSEAIATEDLSHLHQVVQLFGNDPSLDLARITDSEGHVLYSSQDAEERERLTPQERAEMRRSRGEAPHFFSMDIWSGEVVMPIYSEGVLRGYAWVVGKGAWNRELFYLLLRGVGYFAVACVLASVGMVWMVTRKISRPLSGILQGMRNFSTAYDTGDFFPLKGNTKNELGELIQVFNQMVMRQIRQREGMEDTLSLLDSVLIYAPIGLVFFDQRRRIARCNSVFEQMTAARSGHSVGCRMKDICSAETAGKLEEIMDQVFYQQQAVHNLDVNGRNLESEKSWAWLVHAYPVKSGQRHVRWVGMIAVDITGRRLAQDALRKSEKLAATGRLAASVAHEINNPLEAVTNLLFMLRSFCGLEGEAAHYVEMVEHEVRRIAEITQQTLRFFRQPTRPMRTNMSQLLDAVLNLYQNKIISMHMQVERRYDETLDLFCFSGELHQIFTNLIGNALEASQSGGRLLVRAHRSRNWKNPQQNGVRFCVADSGCGMNAEVRKHIFEAFFTTKEDTGTGLGLWVSHELVGRHGGMIHLRSRVAERGGASGTVFELFFPDDPALLEKNVRRLEEAAV